MTQLTEQEFYKKVGERLRKFRKDANLTLKEVADTAGIYPGDLGMLEREGKRIKSANIIRRIAEATGHTIEEVFSGLQLPEKKKPENPLQYIKQKWNEFSELTDTVLDMMEEDAQASRARTADQQEHDDEDCEAEFSHA